MTDVSATLRRLDLSAGAGRFGTTVAILGLLVPATVITVDHGGSVPTFLLFVIGLVMVFRRRLWADLRNHEWALLATFALYPAVSVVAAGYGGWTETGLDKMNEHLRLLQFIPIYMLFRYVRLRREALWIGLIAGAIGAGISAVIEVAWLGKGRATGANNFIHFGNISVIMGFAALAAAPLLKRKGKVLAVLPWVALVAGVTACVLSGTRGAMLFLPVGFVLAAIYFTVTIGARVLVPLLCVPVVAFAVGLAVPNSQLADRLHDTVENLSEYERGGAKSSTSVGLRLEMWLTSAEVVAENPVAGVGLGGFRDAMRPYVERGVTNRNVLNYDHAHNAYISTQLTRGLPGTIALLAILAIPLVLGLRDLWRRDAELRAWAYVVVVIASGYAVHAFPNNIFERGLTLSFFVTTLAMAASGLENARRDASERA